MTASPEWWRGAVIYQITPRSFRDSSSEAIVLPPYQALFAELHQ